MENPESVSIKSTSADRVPESFCENTFEEDDVQNPVQKDPGPICRHYSSNKKAWRG